MIRILTKGNIVYRDPTSKFRATQRSLFDSYMWAAFALIGLVACYEPPLSFSLNWVFEVAWSLLLILHLVAIVNMHSRLGEEERRSIERANHPEGKSLTGLEQLLFTIQDKNPDAPVIQTIRTEISQLWPKVHPRTSDQAEAAVESLL